MCIRDRVETVTDGKLTVATSPDFAPYEFYSIDEDGNPTLSGFDMDLAQYIADKMGLEPVSYTHLDVYKRQLMRCRNAKKLLLRLNFLWKKGAFDIF